MSHAAAIAKTCDQRTSKGEATSTVSSHEKAWRIPSVRVNPMVILAIDAGLATTNQVHM